MASIASAFNACGYEQKLHLHKGNLTLLHTMQQCIVMIVKCACALICTILTDERMGGMLPIHSYECMGHTKVCQTHNSFYSA